MPEPAPCSLTEGAWVAKDLPSETTYFFSNGSLHQVGR